MHALDVLALRPFVDAYLEALLELRYSDVLRSPCFGYGRGGIAYALLRAGTLRGDRALITRAHAWATAGVRTARRFRLRGWPKSSFSRGLAGLHAIEALASRAMNDDASSRAELQAFVAASRRGRGTMELFQGLAGRLAGAAIVARRCADPSVIALGDELAARIVAALHANRLALPPDGIAHGTPGALLGALAWNAVRPSLPARDLVPALRAQHPYRARNPGWAWGHAGMALLFARAYQQFQEPAFLRWARAAGERACVPLRSPFLVDGLAGVAYCLRALADVDADGPWLTRAIALAHQAIAQGDVPARCPYGVWSGLSGVFCLALDLEHGASVGFPGIEA
jgi:lanthionine synthetase-like protein